MRKSTAAMAVAGLALLVGCSAGGGSDSAGGGESDSASDRTPAQLVRDLAGGDQANGQQAILREGGSEVQNQVTLDYCGFTYQTEAERVQRYQVSVTDDGATLGSNEAVFYAPGGAERALEEVRKAVADCPADEIRDSTVAGVPPMRYVSEPLGADATANLTEDHVAIRATATQESGEATEAVLIYQRRGDAMLASYGEDEASTVALAEFGAEQLAAASAAEVGE